MEPPDPRPGDQPAPYVPKHAKPPVPVDPEPVEPAAPAGEPEPAAASPPPPPDADPAPAVSPVFEGPEPRPDPDSEPAAGAEEPPDKPKSKAGVNPFVELVVILAVAFGLAYLVQGWVVKPYRIPSISMEPTLKIGDMVLVNRFIYRFHGPRRGDVIVFHPPGRGQNPIRGATTEADVNFIKRVIGLPGETIQVINGTVFICSAPHQNCHGLREPYAVKQPTGNYGPFTIPKGDYFVMGDNRPDSDDSRDWGPLPRRNIIGEAFVIYWPLRRISTL
jgi:signal peptidase I